MPTVKYLIINILISVGTHSLYHYCSSASQQLAACIQILKSPFRTNKRKLWIFRPNKPNNWHSVRIKHQQTIHKNWNFIRRDQWSSKQSTRTSSTPPRSRTMTFKTQEPSTNISISLRPSTLASESEISSRLPEIAQRVLEFSWMT